MRARVLFGFLVAAAAQGVVGFVAVEAIKASVSPSTERDAVLLWIWPLVIVVGGLVAIVLIWRLPTGPTATPTTRQRPSRQTSNAAESDPDGAPLAAPLAVPPPSSSREYVPSNVTVAYLVSHFAGRTGIQGAKLVSVYLDKWMRVSGPLGNVGTGPDLYQVTFEGAANKTYMYFRDPKAVERLSMLVVGQTIVVDGRVTKISASWVDLEDCELIEP